MIHQEITEQILSSFYKVYNTLGYGFLEKVYENALTLELREKNLDVEQQYNLKVFYKDQEVGSYFADLIVDQKIVIELKAAESICPEHKCQLINYLKATQIEIGLLLNFGKKAEFSRVIFTNDKKDKRIEHG
jgi:GxxExxY protein